MKRIPLRILAPLAFLAAFSATHREASAQSTGPEYLPSDVMLLLDTSGSMSYTTVREPEDTTRYGLPRCGSFDSAVASTRAKPMSFDSNADFSAGEPTPADRWAILVNAFTGTIVGPACSSHQRSSDSFNKEFALREFASSGSNERVYDADYHLPFNRIVATSGTGAQCTPAPSWDATFRAEYFGSGNHNPMDWPSNSPVYWRDMNAAIGTVAACPFSPQLNNGVIDRLLSTVRFGLMTFDPIPHTPERILGTGLMGLLPNYASGSSDAWSYFPGWLSYPASTGGPSEGWPAGCAGPVGSSQFYEVGSRNPAAPPWEGRLIDFGHPEATTEQITAHNERVKQAILGMRPYGGTPIAGMLSDALYFMTEDDTTPESIDGVKFYGGATDPYVKMKDRSTRGCRKRIAILITDGGPNLDLRPHCAGTSGGIAGRCPYKTPQDYAKSLYDKNIDLFVVGFSVTAAGEGSTLTCSQLMDSENPSHRECSSLSSCTTACGSNNCAYGYCINTSPAQRAVDELLAVCCNLESIANAGSRYDDPDGAMTVGSPRHAYFAESGTDLVAALTSILRFPSSVMTRSQPVFATGNVAASGSEGTIAGARFFSSFDPLEDDLYAGHLVRERYECAVDPSDPGSGPVAKEQVVDSAKGDLFEVNVNGSGSLLPNRELRNIYTVVADQYTDDHLPRSIIYSDRSVRPMLNGSDPDGLGAIGGKPFNGSALSMKSSVPAGALFGQSTCGAPEPSCCPAYPGNPTPVADQCRDRYLGLQLGFPYTNDSESTYVRASALGALINSTPEIVMAPSNFLRDESYQLYQSSFADRAPVLYAATADGQIHAFTINKLDNKLNELWSFMPPAILPQIPDQFPTRFKAANKTLISGPLVAAEVSGDRNPSDATGHFLTRSAPSAEQQDNSKWYSVLVGSFGASGGYYAIDVTNPDPSSDKYAIGYNYAGPRFLWQLTTDRNGDPLFGSRSTRPAVATLYFIMPGAETAAQHAVAILPGGYGGVRSTDSYMKAGATGKVRLDVTARTETAEYTPVNTTSRKDILTLGGARSLTIVRLDTGEVIRSFRRSRDPNDNEAPTALYDKDRVTGALFTAPMVGSIVAYPNTAGSVADRAFVGDAEGRLWRVDLASTNPENWSVDLFHDAYPIGGPGMGSYSLSDIEPIETPPILSTDPMGRLTIAVSTGEQTNIGETGKHSVWSLSEWMDDGIVSHVNWFLNDSNSTESGGSQENHFVPGTGERVTGPMALFSSILYFTTYNPSSRDPISCSPGNSFLWGVHYLQAGHTALDMANNPIDGPKPQFRSSGDEELVRVVDIPNGIAFGVGIQQKPSCIDTSTSEDPFGLVGHQAVSTVSPGAYQLLVQVGSNQLPSSSFGRVDSFDLPPPSARSLIDSWAAILE